MPFESQQLRCPQRFRIREPALQIACPALLQRINAHPCVQSVMAFLDKAAAAQDAKMAAHRRRGEIERLCQLARPARPLAQQFNGAAPDRVGERGERQVNCPSQSSRCQSSRFRVVMPLALSQASGDIFSTVTPNVQM